MPISKIGLLAKHALGISLSEVTFCQTITTMQAIQQTLQREFMLCRLGSSSIGRFTPIRDVFRDREDYLYTIAIWRDDTLNSICLMQPLETALNALADLLRKAGTDLPLPADSSSK